KAAPGADDQPKSDAEDGAPNHNDFEVISLKPYVRKLRNEDHEARKEEDRNAHVDHENFTYRLVGQVDKRKVEKDEEVGDQVFAEDLAEDHGDTDYAAVDQLVRDEEHFDRKSC